MIVGRTDDDSADLDHLGLPPNVINRWDASAREALRAITAGVPSPLEVDDIDRVTAGLRELTEPMFMDLDALIIWVGQHGTSNQRIPKIVGKSGVHELTKPQDSFIYYAGYLLNGINRWRDLDPIRHQETWLIPDVRNYLKGRDLKWPPPTILGQYDFTKQEKHYRWGDPTEPEVWAPHLGVNGLAWDEPGVWKAMHSYVYSQLEIVGIPSSVECSYEWEGRTHFGILINEARGYTKLNRLDAMRTWVMPLMPAWIGGTWSKKSMETLGVEISPIPWHQTWDYVRSSKCTFTTPSSGSGWATTKPWEAFAVGTVCFFHPAYDDQGHIIPTRAHVLQGRVDHDPELKALAEWLRPRTPDDLRKAVERLDHDRDAWLWLVQAQRRLFDRAMAEQRCIGMIESSCRLTT